MVDNGSVPKQPLPHLGFVASNLTICVTMIRLILILGLLPNEIRPFLDLPAVRSATVRVRDTRRFLQVAAAFRNLFPTFQEAYSASTSLVSPLVLAVYLSVEHAWAPLPEYWRQVLWGIGLLVIDFLVAKTMEQIASCCMMQGDKERREERLQDKMPDAIRPSRGHLFQITSTVDQNGAKPLLVWKDIPLLAAQLYYASPMTCIGSGLFGSFQNLYCLLFLWSLHEMMMFKAGRPRVALASLALALAAYGQPWFISFSIPIVISQPTIKSARRFVALLVLWALWLQVLSYLLVGTDAYWTWKPTRSLTPNLGPTWYFQMQLFDRFQHYFALMFTGLPYVLLIPLTIRLYRYPIELTTCLWFIGALFHQNPTLYDFNVGLCLMLLSPRSLARMNTVSIIALCSIAVPISLYVLDYGLWLETGTGNANYIYFQCLAYNAFVAMIFLDFTGASLRRDKALRLTEKGSLDKPREGEIQS